MACIEANALSLGWSNKMSIERLISVGDHIWCLIMIFLYLKESIYILQTFIKKGDFAMDEDFSYTFSDGNGI